MGLVDKISTQDAVVYLWKIQETLQELQHGIDLKLQSQQRLQNMRSLTHQKGFMAIRQLLKLAGYTDFDLWYDSHGKPNLTNGKHISISHSFGYAAIIIGNSNVGIDIEQKRDKIVKIAPKFCNEVELEKITGCLDQIDLFSEVWCVKESMYKMCESRSLSFKNHMFVNMQGDSWVIKDDFKLYFNYYVLDLDDFKLAYAFEKVK